MQNTELNLENVIIKEFQVVFNVPFFVGTRYPNYT